MSEAIKKCLVKMDEIDARAITITFDGLASNFAAVDLLGAQVDFKLPNIKPCFPHPSSGGNVFVIPDPCHMFKLLRNTLKASKVLFDASGKKIEWRFLDSLLELQSESGLRAGNKLTKRHVNFENQKMKVKLCTQVLSNSVAVALDVCRKLNIEQFEGSETTADFLKLMDRLFDALNSRPSGRGLKAPLRLSSKPVWFALFRDAKKYLLGLHCKGRNDDQPNVPLIYTKRGTCVRGLVICIKSIEMIMEEIVDEDSEDLVYLAVYKLSQDLIKLFFSTIRSRFGFNNNPNVLQLEHSLKGILCMKMQLGTNGNCLPQDDVSVRISPLGNMKRLRNPDEIFESESLVEEITELPDYNSMSLFISNVVAYISGFVGRRLCQTLSCASCIRALIPSNLDSVRVRSDCVLINSKNNGGLFVPSEDLIRVCKIAEAEIRVAQGKGLKSVDKTAICSQKVRHANSALVFYSLRNENSELHPLFSDHTFKLISSAAEQYLKVRLHYMAKEATLNLSPARNRNTCTKSVHFAGN